MYQDYGTHKAAIFAGGRLLREGLSFNDARANYSHFTLSSSAQGPTYLDEVCIDTNVPPNMTGNYDGDYAVDALELWRYGTATNFNTPHGATYLIR